MRFVYIIIFLLITSCNSFKKITKKHINLEDPIVLIELDSTKDTEVFVEEMVGRSHPERTVLLTSGDYPKPKDLIKKTNLPNEKKKEDNPNLISGLIAYSVPNEMIVGNNYIIKVRISKEKDSTKLIIGDRNIPIGSEDSKITIESIRVEPVMSSELISNESFKITKLSTEEQNIEDFGYTEWAWNVLPVTTKNDLLKLIVKVRIKNEQGEFYKDIVVFDKDILVKPNYWYTIKIWIISYWQWIMSTIFIPLIVFFYKKKSEKKPKRKLKF